ncbi:CaiB/BaiF CoA transferase family protein [Candidatus Poriferisodalis sp.]|uniref:CaiB/BaiF CoA transferase family protein n=1 Tax=Candidatus Poriferisodalis sp. TaxID=3101277 RepID=UPI003B018D6B
MSESDTGAGEPARPLPLDGVVVLDLGQIYQGPYAGLLLAYSGARVIKVEHPRGEALRGHSHQLPFAMLNSSKEIMSLDLKSPRGRELFIGLAGAADAVLCNFAPGVPERLGIDAETLWQTNPKLVFAQASGYGLDGPDAQRTAMDVTVQAHMGVMSINGFADRPPVKSGATFIDFLGGTHLYGAVVTALFEAQRTGRGRLVSTSMAEAAYYTLTTSLQAWQMHGVTGRMGNRNAAMSVSPSNVYPCSDGHIALIAAMNSHWRAVLEVIGRADLLGDERLRSNAGRCEHMDEVDALVTAWTSERTRAEAAAALSAAGVPVAEVREVTDVVHDDHMIERGFLQWTELDGLGEIPLAHSPLRWHGSDMREVEPYRPVGADNETIYREFCGLDADDLAALAAERII